MLCRHPAISLLHSLDFLPANLATMTPPTRPVCISLKSLESFNAELTVAWFQWCHTAPPTFELIGLSGGESILRTRPQSAKVCWTGNDPGDTRASRHRSRKYSRRYPTLDRDRTLLAFSCNHLKSCSESTEIVEPSEMPNVTVHLSRMAASTMCPSLSGTSSLFSRNGNMVIRTSISGCRSFSKRSTEPQNGSPALFDFQTNDQQQ